MVNLMDYRTKQSEAFKWAHAILTHLEQETCLQAVATLAHFLIQEEVARTIFHSILTIEHSPSLKSLVDELNEA